MRITIHHLVALVSVLGVSVASYAREFEMVCHKKYYRCYDRDDGGKACLWATAIGISRTISMTQDNAYPNDNSPYEVWHSKYEEILFNGSSQAKVRILTRFTTNSNWPSFSSSIEFTQGDLVAVSSGSNTVEAGIRDGRTGVGFLCHSFELGNDR